MRRDQSFGGFGFDEHRVLDDGVSPKVADFEATKNNANRDLSLQPKSHPRADARACGIRRSCGGHQTGVHSSAVALGQRHVAYGVVREHYGPAGSCLLEALENELGPALTPDIRDAWSEGYSLISVIMIRAAERTKARGAA